MRQKKVRYYPIIRPVTGNWFENFGPCGPILKMVGWTMFPWKNSPPVEEQSWRMCGEGKTINNISMDKIYVPGRQFFLERCTCK